MNSALIVCTRNRPKEIGRLLDEVTNQTDIPSLVLVTDSSESKWSLETFQTWKDKIPGLVYLASKSGLPYQRNVALAHLEKLSEKLDFVSFLDDDVSIAPVYFSKVASFFREFQRFDGVGAWDSKLSLPESHMRAILQLGTRSQSGQILQSGIAVPPSDVQKVSPVEWFPGFGMNFRWSVLENFRFDGRFRMYGEDIEALMRFPGSLAVSPEIKLHHFNAPTGRSSQQQIQYQNDAVRFRLARTHKAKLSMGWVLATTMALAIGELILGAIKFDWDAILRSKGHTKFLGDLILWRIDPETVLHDHLMLEPEFTFS